MMTLKPGGIVEITTEMETFVLLEDMIIRDVKTVSRLLQADNQVKLFDDPIANNLAHKLLKKIIIGEQ